MKTIPMKHQGDALEASDGKKYFGYFMEQGTGKTWTTLADAERAYLAGKIDGVVVFAPHGVHSNWCLREIPTHLSVKSICHIWRGTPRTKPQLARLEELFKKFPYARQPLRVFAINFEAVLQEATYAAIERFLNEFRTMTVVDESKRIGNNDAKRTKKILKIRDAGAARRILTGTPLTKGPTDLYSQCEFLSPGLLGTTSYRAFVAEYSVLLKPDDPKMQAILRKLAGRVRGIPQVVATDDSGNPMYKNLDKLSRLLKPFTFRVRKEDCLDLPPKVYQSAYFELTPAQRRIYDRLKEEYEYAEKVYIEQHAANADDVEQARIMFRTHSFEGIAARAKRKQVTSGFINIEGDAILMPPEDNPRLALFKEVVEDIDGQFLVWAMYEVEIRQIAQTLTDSGYRVATYYGATPKSQRESIIDDFQAGKIDVIVGHAAAMGIGLTLTAAKTAVYYSCSDDAELRWQSEDRNHRIGTKSSVLYIDLIAEGTIDEDIARSHKFKSRVAEIVIDGKELTL